MCYRALQTLLYSRLTFLLTELAFLLTNHVLTKKTTPKELSMTHSIKPQDTMFSESNDALWRIEENYTPLDWFKKAFKNTFNYSGRARRKEFWYFMLITAVISFVAGIIDYTVGDQLIRNDEALKGLVGFILFFPGLAVSVRRLHDIGKSGWWYLISIVPLIGALVLMFWFLNDTTPVTNKWGKPAKRVR